MPFPLPVPGSVARLPKTQARAAATAWRPLRSFGKTVRYVLFHRPFMASTANLHRHPDPHVLIVEDEQRLRDLLLRSLTNWGFDASAARSAEEAMRHSDVSPPDIVLLDLNLPGMDGLEF